MFIHVTILSLLTPRRQPGRNPCEELKRRVYNGTRSRAVETFRIVDVWNDEEERYHLYIMNLPEENYSAPDIATLYQARWEMDFSFGS